MKGGVKMKNKNVILSIVTFFALFVFSYSAYAADATIVVSGNTSAGENQEGWMFNRDTNTDTPFEFNTDKASMGNGSLYVLPIGANASDKFIAENFIKAPVSDLNSIAYDFLIAGNGESSDAEEFYLNVYATIDNSNEYYDCRFDYVPNTGSTTDFNTATFLSTDTPVNVAKRGTRIGACPATLAGMPGGSHVRAFAISIGDTSANDTGLAGYLDKVVVNRDSGVTTYDLEPFAPTGQITNPASDGTSVSGTYNFTATYNDGDEENDDAVQWAIRQGTCAASTGTVAGNVDGKNNPFTWTGSAFTAQVDTSGFTPGTYCFVFNPTDDPGQGDVRLTRTFVIEEVAPNPYPVPEVCTGTYGAPIVGTERSDVINGTNGNDLIYALGGSDVVNGRGGDDCIVGGNGSNSLVGGAGNDVIIGGNSADSIQGDAGNDTLYGHGGTDSLRGGNNDDTLFGGDGSDSLQGENGNDVLSGGSGSDSLVGGTGNDTLTGDAGSDLALGNNGSDTCSAETRLQCEL